MRHGERVHHIHASGDPTADGHFADAEKIGAFAEVNGGFESSFEHHSLIFKDFRLRKGSEFFALVEKVCPKCA